MGMNYALGARRSWFRPRNSGKCIHVDALNIVFLDLLYWRARFSIDSGSEIPLILTPDPATVTPEWLSLTRPPLDTSVAPSWNEAWARHAGEVALSPEHVAIGARHPYQLLALEQQLPINDTELVRKSQWVGACARETANIVKRDNGYGPEFAINDALVAAYSLGLRRVIELPISEPFARRLSASTVIISHATRRNASEYARAVGPDENRAGYNVG